MKNTLEELSNTHPLAPIVTDKLFKTTVLMVVAKKTLPSNQHVILLDSESSQIKSFLHLLGTQLVKFEKLLEKYHSIYHHILMHHIVLKPTILVI